MLGINNLADGDPAEAIAGGLAAIMEAARRLWRDPDVMLVTVPRALSMNGPGETERARLNALLATDLGKSGRVQLLNADLALAGEIGKDTSRESDGIHLSRHGYELLSQALGGVIASFAPHQRATGQQGLP
jgi:lysophospholipase L1-like esterase